MAKTRTPKDQPGAIIVPRIVNGRRVASAIIKDETFKGFARCCAEQAAA